MRLRKEAKIGIFGILMLLLLIWGINFLKGRDIFVSTRTYYTTFDKADGLKPSTEIRLRGLKIGQVTDITYNPLKDDKISVEFTVNAGYKIPVDSRIVAYNTYIVGGTVLNLEYGASGTFFEHYDTIPSVGAKDAVNMLANEVEEIRDKLYSVVTNLNSTLGSVQSVLNDENVEALGNTLKNVDRIIATDIQDITQNLNSVSKVLSDNTSRIDNIIGNVENFSDSLAVINITQMVAGINNTVGQINELIAKVNEGDGTLPMLINDRALYDSLVSASGSLSVLLDDLKANPKRYVHFSLFGRKNK